MPPRKKAAKKAEQPKMAKLALQDTPAVGRFASTVSVNVAEDHCVLTFLVVEPLDATEETTYLAARIFLTRPHFKKLAEVLEGEVKKMKEGEAGSSG